MDHPSGCGPPCHATQQAAAHPSIPPELLGVAPDVLESYVQSRLRTFTRQLSQALSTPNVEDVASALLGPPQQASASTARQPDAGVGAGRMVLLFTHDCQSLGCADAACELCYHNPARRCEANFARKYLVGDKLRPKCDAPIFVSLVDVATGRRASHVSELTVEACLVNGVEYDAAQRAEEDAGVPFSGGRQQQQEEAGAAEGDGAEAGSGRSRRTGVGGKQQRQQQMLSELALPTNKEGDALLVVGEGGTADANTHSVVFRLKDGVARLPAMHVTASSEALLSGRKPPFRLWVRVAGEPGSVQVAHDLVSEPFVVATKRVRTAGKVDTPSVHDDISKIRNMGKETVKKLADLKAAAMQAGIDLPGGMGISRVTKVAEFQELARASASDAQLALKLQQLLKMSRPKWQQACEHAASAVRPDSRLRVWYSDPVAMQTGLLFACTMGCAEMERPVALLQRGGLDPDTGRVSMVATLTAGQTPGQRQEAAELKALAVQSWWQAGHPGWAIYPQDTESFLAAAQGQGLTARITAPSVPQQQQQQNAALALAQAQVASAAPPRPASRATPPALPLQPPQHPTAPGILQPPPHALQHPPHHQQQALLPQQQQHPQRQHSPPQQHLSAFATDAPALQQQGSHLPQQAPHMASAASAHMASAASGPLPQAHGPSQQAAHMASAASGPPPQAHGLSQQAAHMASAASVHMASAASGPPPQAHGLSQQAAPMTAAASGPPPQAHDLLTSGVGAGGAPPAPPGMLLSGLGQLPSVPLSLHQSMRSLPDFSYLALPGGMPPGAAHHHPAATITPKQQQQQQQPGQQQQQPGQQQQQPTVQEWLLEQQGMLLGSGLSQGMSTGMLLMPGPHSIDSTGLPDLQHGTESGRLSPLLAAWGGMSGGGGQVPMSAWLGGGSSGAGEGEGGGPTLAPVAAQEQQQPLHDLAGALQQQTQQQQQAQQQQQGGLRPPSQQHMHQQPPAVALSGASSLQGMQGMQGVQGEGVDTAAQQAHRPPYMMGKSSSQHLPEPKRPRLP